MSLGRPAHELVAMLSRTENGGTQPTLSNAIILMMHDAPLAGLLATDAFRAAPMITRPAPPPYDGAPELPGPYPRVWQGEDVALVQGYMQRLWSHRFSRATVEEAMAAAAALRTFHPVAEWLAALRWDGQRRLDQMMRRAFGCDDTEYAAAVGAKFLIAAVRRIRRPGCKFDHMPVLEGGQGIGKSTAIKALFSEDLFSDSIPADLAGRDAALALSGVWGLEFGEIDHLIRAEVEVIKAFLSRTTDRFRPPYGRTFVERPRQCVFIGTTNSQDYLRDATGNRRIWPVRCRYADAPWIQANREQLWAEAAAREASGEALWLHEASTAAEADRAQQERMAEDPWSDAVRAYCAQHSEVRINAVLHHGVGLAIEKQTRREEMRVAAILKADRWTVEFAWREGKSRRVWRKPEGEAA